MGIFSFGRMQEVMLIPDESSLACSVDQSINHRGHISNTLLRCSKLHLRTPSRHLANFLRQQILKRPNCWTHVSSSLKVVGESMRQRFLVFSFIFSVFMRLLILALQ